MLVFKWLKMLMCKHEKTTYCRTFLEKISPGEYKVHHVWKCEKCGKEIY